MSFSVSSQAQPPTTLRAFLSEATGPRWLRSTRLLLGTFALAAILRALFVVASRFRYEGELEWMEGGMLVHVQRVLAGEPLYAAPSLDFTAYLYPPLYAWLGALAARIGGLDLVTLRVVTLLGSLGVFAMLGVMSTARTGSRLLGLVCVGFFAATFRLSGAWFDVARVDTIFLLLLLISLHALTRARGRHAPLIASVAMLAAVLTKQSALIAMIVVTPYSFIRGRREGLLFLVPLVVGLGLSFGYLHATTFGWSTYYVFELPRSHPILDGFPLGFWTRDVFGKVPFLALGTIAAIALGVRPASGRDSEDPKGRWRLPSAASLELPTLVLALVIPAWLGRFHSGQYDNVLMPMHAALALGLTDLLGKLDKHRGTLLIGTAMGIGAIVSRNYSLSAQIPAPSNAVRLSSVKAELARLEGPLWLGTFESLAIDRPNAAKGHAMALFDIARGAEDQVRTKMFADIATRMRAREFRYLVLPEDITIQWLQPTLRLGYRRTRALEIPAPVTGFPSTKLQLWEPRPQPLLAPPTGAPARSPK